MKNFFSAPRRWARLLPVAALLLGAPTACRLDVVNPNAATDAQTLGTREGLLALSVGLRQLYSASALEPIILAPATTAREVKGVATFINVTDLETGGAALPNDNANLTNLFARSLRVVGVADQLIAAAPAVLSTDAGTRSGVLAHAYLFKAAALGALAEAFEQAPITTSTTGQAAFVPRAQVLAEAVRLLDLATTELAANVASTDFTTQVLGTAFNLPNTVQAYRARLNLAAGNYAAALAAANLVDLTVRSVFSYSSQSPNPIYQSVNITRNFAPRGNFGLPAGFVAAVDRRRGFFLTGARVASPPDSLRTLAGFFTSLTSDIPAYQPDEMRLVRAEANLRLATPNVAGALVDINAVRTQTTGDPFGVYAALPAYSGPTAVADLLLEVYKQRSVELFLSGQRLEDSRRFGRPGPPASTAERTRNFYPYPRQERLNNPNVPADPAI